MMDEDLLTSYCDYLRVMGHRVIRTGDNLWIDIRPRIFQTAPPFKLGNIEAEEVREVLRSGEAIACRWFSQSFRVPHMSDLARPMLYSLTPPYDLSSLNQKARNQTRRGMERVSVQRVEMSESLEQRCYRVYEDNLNRLGLLQKKGQMVNKWLRWVAAIKMGKCVELWTASSENELLAFSVAVRSPWGTEIVLQRSIGSGRGLYPNNALVFEMVRDSFSRGAEVISFGLSGYFSSKNGLDHFKQSMGFRSLPLDEHYSWNPLLRPFAPLLRPTRLRSLYRRLSKKK